MADFVKIELQESDDEVEYIGDEDCDEDMENINTSQHTGAFNFPESVPQSDQLGQNLDEEKLKGKAH
ncbi:unnamed protein product [Oikopleura dioica]|uniref:Uncharacterized protein n=1 Tax=Oikopleura dioica TaxID=34765 RepID=E4YER5_OIKDI|nr:unnamed protein product [Oikopleura dioica]